MSDRLVDYPVEMSRALMASFAVDRTNIDRFLQDLGAIFRVDWTDGLRVVLDDGSVVHLRPSGNAPEMRCYVEAPTVDVAHGLLHTMLTRLRKSVAGDL